MIGPFYEHAGNYTPHRSGRCRGVTVCGSVARDVACCPRHGGDSVVTRDTPWPDGTPSWVDLGTRDIPESNRFYASLFGWSIEQGPPEVGGYSMARLEGRNVAAIGPIMGPPETPSSWSTYFAVSDADAAAARVTSAGGQLIAGPMDVMEAGRLVVASDVTGAVFGLWQAGEHTGGEMANVPGAVAWRE